jgi:anion-transporting  ArsA/GET3 family ATPase
MNKLSIIPNKIIQSSACCINCGKGYKTRKNLEKHTILCELSYNSKKSTAVHEEEPLPSQHKMYQMLIELSQKYNRLNEKVDELNKWVIKKKKKINVLEWLNANIIPELVFGNLAEKVIIQDEDVEFMLNNTFNDTLNVIFSRNIYVINEQSNPIFAFSQKPNIFYIYDKAEDTSMWVELSKEKLVRFMCIVQMKISKTFCEWKKKNQDLLNTDKMAILCDKATVKLMSQEFKQESTLSKIRSIMYGKMKTDMKALVEYEFEF